MKLRAMKLDVMKPRAMKLHGMKPHYHLLSYLSLNLYHYQIPEFYVLMMIIRVFVRNFFILIDLIETKIQYRESIAFYIL